MSQTKIVKFCRDLGCCDACCLRYIGLRTPSAYESVQQFIRKFADTSNDSQKSEVSADSTTNTESYSEERTDEDKKEEKNGKVSGNEPVEENLQIQEDILGDAPPPKRIKLDNVCVTCLGVLQEETWPEGFAMVQEVLDKKCYECDTIACALSYPIAVLMRERAVVLQLQDTFPDYELKNVMPLKEAWKWSFGRRLAAHVNKQLDSGAVAPLLVTLNVEYPDEPRELEALKQLAPELFRARSQQRRRYCVEFTRRAAELALAAAPPAALAALPAWRAGPPRPAAPARPVSAAAAHVPAYVGGRYLKLSRTLPQTPWLVAGRRMLHSSVQEIIVEPVAAAYGLNPEEAAQRVKFMSAGREDVDVRCLGTGRPFALEIADPRRTPSAEELQAAAAESNAGGKVLVRDLVPVTREDLMQLKRGEEFKCKTYEALCIKLEHTEHDRASGSAAVAVTERDLAALNAYCGAGGVRLQQRTPVRVLHRRPLLVRARSLYSLQARAVPGHAALFAVRVRAQAGTYVKEWAHGELGRTRPALAAALGARADILALDVADVDLPWPPTK